MSAKIPPPRDLFGHPWSQPRDPRGRKAYKRDEQVAKKIAVSRATGATVEQLCKLSGLSEPTLRKYYFRELQEATDLVEAAVNEAIFDQAMSGRVGAQRLMKEMLARGQAAVPIGPTARSAKPAAAKTQKLGKKAQLVEDAKVGAKGGKWPDLLN